MTSYYDVLGIDKNATATDIKKAYKSLAQKYHPDVNHETNATQKFKEINTAYQTLKDPQKRAEYDNPVKHNQQHFHASNIDEMLRRMAEDMMRNQGFSHRQQYPMANVHISLEEAYTGTTRTLNGKIFNIPAGVRNGNQLLVDDFIIIVNVARHAKFKRSNDDLLTSVQIDAIEAMLGVECNLTLIDNSIVKVKIPPGIQHGKLVRVAGKGMPNPEIANHHGDMLVHVSVLIPDDLTNEEKDSILNIRHRKSFDA